MLFLHILSLKMIGCWVMISSCIYQQGNVTPHTHQESLAWCEENFMYFIDNHKWPPNSPDLNALDYYVWDAITNNIQRDKVRNHGLLIDEIRKEIHRVSNTDLLRSVENWSHRILLILKTKGAQLKYALLYTL